MKRLLTITLSLFLFLHNTSAQTNLVKSPADNAKDVCVDTHLTLTFNSPVEAGKKGMIRVFDVTANEWVDSLDMSIPAGPTESRQYAPECTYTKIPYDYSRSSMPTNRTVKPGTPSGTAEPTPPEYQLNIIGGFTDAFHFYPIITKDNTATIYLHNNVLEYGHTYKVSIDSSVLVGAGFNGINSWTFTTKADVPKSNKLKVNKEGKGDFATVQGALDHIPDFSPTPYYIYIGEGDYEELVYARNKQNVTIIGAGMDKTRVHYANNEVFNPHPLTVKTNEWPGTFPSRRAAFDLDNCNNINIKDITIATDFKGQAEGLLINGERFHLQRVHIIGSGDALQANGSIFMEECEMDGDTDAILSRGSIYAYRCNFRNDGGPYAWIRNTKGHHGLVMNECTISTFNGKPVDYARTPTNHGTSYPDAEMVLINCKVSETRPEGWGVIGEPTATMLEFNTCDIKTGKPVDTSKRHPFSKQLDKKKDAELIKKYKDRRWVLGW